MFSRPPSNCPRLTRQPRVGPHGRKSGWSGAPVSSRPEKKALALTEPGAFRTNKPRGGGPFFLKGTGTEGGSIATTVLEYRYGLLNIQYRSGNGQLDVWFIRRVFGRAISAQTAAHPLMPDIGSVT